MAFDEFLAARVRDVISRRRGFEVLESDKRPVSAVADHTETRSVTRVEVAQENGIELFMMFDPGHSLDERILSEQFRY